MVASSTERTGTESKLGPQYSLSAAAHFNLLPLAKRLIAEGHSPTSHNYLFAPPIQVAAQAGNVNMLQFFQEKLPKSTFEPFSVTGAAIRGDIEIVKLALRLPQRTGQSVGGGDATSNPQLRSIEWTSKTGALILGLRRYASSPKVYDYLTSVLVTWPTSLEKSHEDLIMYAMFGNILMVRHLLHLGVPVHVSGYIKGPLAIACRYGHDEIADLLLEHGANPNYVSQIFRPSFPLHDPATASNLSLVCKLLDHGALPNRPGGSPEQGLPALWWAFAREHTKMIDLLLQRGASLDGGPDDKSNKGWVGKSLAEMTCSLGYYSMVEILRQHGVEIVDPPAYRAGNYQFWHRWSDARAIIFRRSN